MSGSKKVWILLLNWNNSKDTLDCLNSIFQCSDSEIQGVVICDNGSKDNSVRTLYFCLEKNKNDFSHLIFKEKSSFEQKKSCNSDTTTLPVYLIENPVNYGFAGGNNVGISFIEQNLEYDYIYLLNNDTEIESGTVSKMVEKFVSNPKVGLCGSKIIYSSKPNIIQTLGGAEFNRVFGRAMNIGAMSHVSDPVDEVQVSNRLDYIHGASMMISKPCLNLIGTMEESYFLYFEEIDWAERAKAAGFQLAFANNSIVYHKEGASIGSSYEKNKRSPLSTYYMTNSRMRFTAKFYPYYLPTVFSLHLYQMIRFALSGNFLHFKTMLKAMLFLRFKNG